MRRIKLNRIDIDLLNRTAVIAAFFYVYEESGERVTEMFGEPFADILISLKPGDVLQDVLEKQAAWLSEQGIDAVSDDDSATIATLVEERHSPTVIDAYRLTQIAARLPEKTPAERTARAAKMSAARKALALAIESGANSRRSPDFSPEEKAEREKRLAFEEINE